MYYVMFQRGNHKEYFTDEKPGYRFWSFQKGEAFLFSSEAEAKQRMRKVIPEYVDKLELKIQYIHPLNLPSQK